MLFIESLGKIYYCPLKDNNSSRTYAKAIGIDGLLSS